MPAGCCPSQFTFWCCLSHAFEMLAEASQRAAEWMNDGRIAKVCCVCCVQSVILQFLPSYVARQAAARTNNTRKSKADIAMFTPSSCLGKSSRLSPPTTDVGCKCLGCHQVAVSYFLARQQCASHVKMSHCNICTSPHGNSVSGNGLLIRLQSIHAEQVNLSYTVARPGGSLLVVLSCTHAHAVAHNQMQICDASSRAHSCKQHPEAKLKCQGQCMCIGCCR